MALKVLAAGCSQEEKERAESDVRRVLGSRAQAEAWMVSLVKLQGRWSVTLDGPGVRAKTCLAPEGRLSESIRDAIQGASAPAPGPASAPAPGRAPAAAPAAGRPASAPGKPAAAPSPAPRAGRSGDRHTCGKCGQGFTVIYESGVDEPQERAAVACPHCWHINHVLIAESAADSKDYRAEKA